MHQLFAPAPLETLQLCFSGYFLLSPPTASYTKGTPVFLSSSGVQGSLLFTASPKSCGLLKTDHIKITLIGYFELSTWARHAMTGGSPHQNVEQQKVLEASILRPANISVDAVSEVRSHGFPFYFQLPQSPSPSWNLHPSSLSLAFTRLDHAFDVSGRVSYSVQASVIRDSRMIARASRQIIVFDSLPPPPPTPADDFVSEFRFQDNAVLLQKPNNECLNISVAAIEPEPLRFSHGENYAVSRVPLSIRFCNVGGLPLALKKTRVDTRLTWQLEANTFFSAHPLESAPIFTKDEISPAFISRMTRAYVKRLDVPLEGAWKIGTESEIVINKDVWLVLPRDLLLPPTFLTTFVARRYAIVMQISFKRPIKGSLRLRVPCQVVYLQKALRADVPAGDAIQADSDSLDPRDLELDLGDELPQYTP